MEGRKEEMTFFVGLVRKLTHSSCLFFLLVRGNDSPVFCVLLFLVLSIDDPPAFFGFGSNGIG